MKQQIPENSNNITKNNYIFNVDESDFVEKVIEKSADNIVLVDFWAPWCGPCKQLTPILEEIINEAEGLLMLAKINIDENQQLAAQLRIQSIPAVIAFHKKQIVNGFQGAIPKSKIIKFIEKIYGSPLPKNKDEFFKNIRDLIEKNELDQAQNIIEDYLAENSNDIKAICLYIRCLCELKKMDNVKNFISSLSDPLLAEQEIKKEIKNYEKIISSSKEPSIETLFAIYKTHPNNIDNILKLSEKYFYEKQTKEALELLLSSFAKFNKKDKDRLKVKLLEFFDLLGYNNEQTKIYRRKFSSLLYS